MNVCSRVHTFLLDIRKEPLRHQGLQPLQVEWTELENNWWTPPFLGFVPHYHPEFYFLLGCHQRLFKQYLTIYCSMSSSAMRSTVVFNRLIIAHTAAINEKERMSLLLLLLALRFFKRLYLLHKGQTVTRQVTIVEKSMRIQTKYLWMNSQHIPKRNTNHTWNQWHLLIIRQTFFAIHTQYIAPLK